MQNRAGQYVSDDSVFKELIRSFDDVLSVEWPVARALRHCTEGKPFDAELWALIAKLGWPGLPVDEQYGGIGGGMGELSALYRELGKRLAPVPVLPTFLAAELVAKAGNPQQRQAWLAPIAEGHLRASVSSPMNAPCVSAVLAGDQIILRGADHSILDLAAVQVVFVAVALQGKGGWVAVDIGTEGMQVSSVRTTDATRSLGMVELNDVRVPLDRLFLEVGDGEIGRQLMQHAAIALASDSVAGGEAILAATIDYLKVREQFGRPIGSFQALKHRVADHKTALAGAAALLDEVVRLAGSSQLDLLDVLSAKYLACNVYAEVARDCIQLFGGIGYTWEHFPHLYLKRAKLNQSLFGTELVLLDKMSELLTAS